MGFFWDLALSMWIDKKTRIISLMKEKELPKIFVRNDQNTNLWEQTGSMLETDAVEDHGL